MGGDTPRTTPTATRTAAPKGPADDTLRGRRQPGRTGYLTLTAAIGPMPHDATAYGTRSAAVSGWPVRLRPTAAAIDARPANSDAQANRGEAD